VNSEKEDTVKPHGAIHHARLAFRLIRASASSRDNQPNSTASEHAVEDTQIRIPASWYC
jgi:hypothetical protein